MDGARPARRMTHGERELPTVSKYNLATLSIHLPTETPNTTMSAGAYRHAKYDTIWHIIHGQGDDSLILESARCGLINLHPWVPGVEGSMRGTNCRTRKSG
jgi:hypothetical protein